MAQDVIAAWHKVVENKDPRAIAALLADEAVFESPVVHTPQVGKPIAAKYLTAALHLLGNDSFRYENEWVGDSSAVLEFALTLDGIAVNGVDMIFWNDAGLITRFKVMVRPLKAINLLHQKMGELRAKA